MPASRTRPGASAIGSDNPGARPADKPAAPPATDTAAIIVAWRPDPHRLPALLAAMSPQVRTVYLVDNAEDEVSAALIRDAARDAGAQRIAMHGNQGIACAQNRGIAAAIAAGHLFALLSDDDSLPPDDLVARLLDGHRRATRAGLAVAAVGPLVCDSRDADAVLAFGQRWIGPRRIAGIRECRTPVQASFLIASGCLIDLEALESIGGMREDLFIDHVDLEWSLRARRAGWLLLLMPDITLAHRLGDRIVRPALLGGRLIHVHAPLRNYYLARNTLALLRSGLLPFGWRIGYLLWLIRYALFNLLALPPRGARLRMLARGLIDGLRGRYGRISSSGG